MTSFGSLFKVLGMQRFRKMNYVAGLSLAAIFVSLLWSWFTTGISSGQVFSVTESWVGSASMVVWILLAIDNEHVYTRDTFRLIPVSDMKLYLTNLLASLSAFVYFGLIHLVLMGISARIDHKFLMDLTHGVGNVPIQKALIVTGLLIILVLVLMILIWTTISFAHLVVRTTGSFLPNIGRRIVNAILYLLIIYLVVRVLVYLIELVSHFGVSFQGDYSPFIFMISIFLGLAIVEAIINIFLLKKWGETIAN